jgi:hypothetical protein
VTENELIGNVMEKYNIIKKANNGMGPGTRWYNIYGAPEFKQGNTLANVKKLGTALAKTAKNTLGADINWSDYYNGTPDKASAYKGRVLLEFSVRDKRPEKQHGSKKKKQKVEVKPFRLKMKKALSTAMEPKTREYSLHAIVFSGTNLPSFGAVTNQQLRYVLC